MMNAYFWGMIAQSIPGATSQPMSRGLAIALTGLLIVFAVLILISLFIAALPRLVGVLHRIFPEPDHAHADHDHTGLDHPVSQLPDDVVIAAIGFVLHNELHCSFTGKQVGN
jgi:Na+-transporting methylmalonyl-CoA/oxaloacetate decarboxylase gamma subunit